MTQGERIYQLRKSRGLTLEQVGNYCGVSKTTVFKWETSAIANMRQDHIARLSELFGVSMAALMGSEEMPPLKDYEIVCDMDLKMIARAGKKMSPEDRATLIGIMKVLHPEAFEEDDT